MGAYLDVPKTEKETESGTMNFGGFKTLPFAVSSMQGWRKTMEDAHIAIANLETQYDVPEGTSLFAVFDGHGGKEVSLFCAKYFTEVLLSLESFKARAYREALIEAFHRIDEMLVDDKYKNELMSFKASPDNDFFTKLAESSNNDEKESENDEDDEDLRKSKNSLYDEFKTDEDEESSNTKTEGEEESNLLTKDEEELGNKIMFGRADSLRLEVKPELLKEGDELNGLENFDESSKEEEKNIEKEEKKVEEEETAEATEEDLKKDIDSIMTDAEEKGTFTKAEALNVLFKMLGMKKNTPVNNEEQQPRFTQSFDLNLPTEAGTTACVALIIEGRLYVANAGDSRAVLCRDNKAHPMSFDHKPEHPLEKQRIEKAGGWVTTFGRVCGNLNLSRCIGDLKYKLNNQISRANQIITAEPDVTVVDITDEDSFLVVACDGVWDILSNEEIVEFVAKEFNNQKDTNSDITTLEKTVEEVFVHCICDDPKYDGKGGDNMTAVIICLRPLLDILASYGSS